MALNLFAMIFFCNTAVVRRGGIAKKQIRIEEGWSESAQKDGNDGVEEGMIGRSDSPLHLADIGNKRNQNF